MKKLLVVLLVLGLAAPAMAQSQWNFYGNARLQVGYYDADENFAGGPALDPTIGADDSALLFSNHANSRFGAFVKASDAISGRMEVGTGSASTNIYTRLLYGEWNFGGGSLLVGQDYSPASVFWFPIVGDIGDTGDGAFFNSGVPYFGRRGQIKLKMAGLQVALIERSGMAVGPYNKMEYTLPKIEAAYSFSTDMLTIRPVLGYQAYKVEDTTTAMGDETITSWLAGIGAQVKLGPATISMAGSYHVNAGNYGQGTRLVAADLLNATAVGNDIEDATLIQGGLNVGFAFSPMMGLNAGVGVQNAKVDVANGVEAKQTGYVVYLQAPINLAQGFTITPEIGHVNRDKVKIDNQPDIDAGKMTYGTLKFQINF